MIYLFIARDCDCIIYETHLEKKIQPAAYEADVYQMLNVF